MKVKTCPAVLLLVLSSHALLSGQNIDPKLAAAFQHTLDSMRTALNVKSLSAALQLPDGNIWAGAQGISSTVPFDSVTPKHVYDIGSVTKTLTAGCILQMADEGLLALDDSLHAWLDTIPHINPNITIRQLLRHQSGLYDVLSASSFQPYMLANYSTIFSPHFAVTNFIQPPLFQPGSGWSYSNTNYMLLGMIIEKIANQAYHLEIRDRFLLPLGLTSTVLLPFEPLPAQVAHVWLDLNGDGISDDGHNFFTNWNSFHSAAAPAGAYFSTASDMAVWMRAYIGDNQLSTTMRTQMQTTVNTGLPGATRYGLGIMERNFIGHKGYGHGGDIAYSASVFYFPGKDLSIAVLNNDSKNNSWTLAPVIEALLKTWMDNETLLDTEDGFPLAQSAVSAFPNPFTDKITATVNLPEPARSLHVDLTDMFGRLVRTLECSDMPEGEQTFSLDGLEHLPAGNYWLRLTVNETMFSTSKLVHIK